VKCSEDNGRRGKVFGYDTPKLWSWRGQREQHPAIRGRAGCHFSDAADQEEAEETTHRMSSCMLAVHSDPNICASGVR
jgi:hypothetical protein